MPKALRLLPISCTVLALVAGTASHGQDAEHSRISPPQPETPVVRTVAPPSPVSSAPRTLEEELGEAVTPEGLVAGVRMCMAVVSPAMELDIQALIDDSWSYTQPRQAENEAGMQFETVSYHKDSLSLMLQDFGPLVQCRVGGRLADLGEVPALRAALANGLGALDTRGEERLAPWVANIQRAAPQTDFDNLFAAGDYSLEIITQSMTGAQIGLDGVDQVHMVMVSSAPFPPRFQSQATN